MSNRQGFIGVFDSGLGGISVLKKLVCQLPHEDFFYFGDTGHNPYGARSADDIFDLSKAIVDNMVCKGAKAVVIACNTATAVAAHKLRTMYPQLPLIGIEPALKQACDAHIYKHILVLATPVTLRMEKFHQLRDRMCACNSANVKISALACDGLAHRIEQGNLDAPDLDNDLRTILAPYIGAVDAVVLGCTHYPFVKDRIVSILGNPVCFDGAAGVAHHVRDVLQDRDLLNDQIESGCVTFATSAHDAHQLDLYEQFYHLPQ